MFKVYIILIVLMPYIAVCDAVDCSCLIHKECVSLVQELPTWPDIDCSRLSHFERVHRGRSICKYVDISYHCAWDVELMMYAELCTKTDVIHAGFRPTIELGLNQQNCTQQRYQPVSIDSNLTFQCIYEKSTCNEEGQLQYDRGTLEKDVSCFCDYQNGYAFVKRPLGIKNCLPSVEDCTCYKKTCPDEGYMLNENYDCVKGTTVGQLNSQSVARLLPQREKQQIVRNPAYDDSMYNIKIQSSSRIYCGAFLFSLAVVCGLICCLLLFVCPLSLRSPSNTVVVEENRNSTIGWTIKGFGLKFKDVTWYKDDVVQPKRGKIYLKESPELTVQIKNAHKDDEGKYKCRIKNCIGLETENTISLTVTKAPTVLEEWEAKDHTIVETGAMERVRQLLKKSSCVTITGHSGSGKSTVMRHIALELKTTENYEVYPTFYPSEIKHNFDKHKKQVFVFDDVFGKYALNLHILDDWIFLMHEIKDFVECGNIKILLTCRTHIANDVRFGRIKWLTVPCCDIQQYPLTRTARDDIASRHGEDVINLTNDDVRSMDLFPLLCETYSKYKEMNLKNADFENFFKDSLIEVVGKIFQNIKKEEKIRFALLALFVICNNVIEESMFVTKNFKDKCRFITHHFDIDDFSTEDIKSHFIELQKYFTKISGTKYKIFHDKIFDAVVFFYGNEMFDIILENAHSDIIRERFHFESLNIQSEIGYLISVPADKEEKYFKRLFIDTNREILNNEITFTAFANRQLQYPSYREKFMNYCKQNEELQQQILLLSFKATSPLLEVSAQGYVDVLEMLIAMDLNVNVCDEKGDTSLHKASALGNLPCVTLLLSKGADANLLNMSGESPLFKASQEGHVDIASELVEVEGVDKDKSVNFTTNARETPLYVSCRGGYFLMAQFLLENGADPLKFDEYLGSPLHISSKENHIKIIEMLLKKGANPNLTTKHIESPLYVASVSGHEKAVALLIEFKADTNICGKDGRSPLCKAAWKGHGAAVNILLNNAADPNKFSEYHESPLYKASRCGHFEIVQKLVISGANVNKCCRDGRSPLYKAAWQNEKRVVKFLLDKGADPNIFSKYFGSPLYRAAKEGYAEMVNILLKCDKTDINLQTKDGETALHAAAKFGHTEIVRILINKRADLNVKDFNGKTPMNEAFKMGHTDTFNLLEDTIVNMSN